MRHALIIGHAGASCDRTVRELWGAGYHSIFRADEPSKVPPPLLQVDLDVIIVLPDQGGKRWAEGIATVACQVEAPIIVATADIEGARSGLGPSATLEGPYPFSDLERARSSAIASMAPQGRRA